MRGFFASTSRSAQRLKAIALERAVTMHPMIASTRSGVSDSCGTASASTTAAAANGIMKIVCEKVTSSPQRRISAIMTFFP